MMSSWRLLGNSRLRAPADIGVEPRILKPLQQSKAKTSLASAKLGGLDSQSAHFWRGYVVAQPTLYCDGWRSFSESLASGGNTTTVGSDMSESTALGVLARLAADHLVVP